MGIRRADNATVSYITLYTLFETDPRKDRDSPDQQVEWHPDCNS